MTSADADSAGDAGGAHAAIRHEPGARRFVTRVDGVDAVVEYTLDGGVMAIVHTGVPPQIGGRGIAADLVQAAFEFARAEGLRVAPRCSYADAYARRHPQYADLLA